MTHPYFDLPPPKSSIGMPSSRPAFRAEPLPMCGDIGRLHRRAVARARDSLPARPQRWLVTGGGRHNPVLMSALRTALGVPVEPVESVAGMATPWRPKPSPIWRSARWQELPLSLPMTTGRPSPHGRRAPGSRRGSTRAVKLTLTRCRFRFALGRRGRAGQDARQIFVDHILQLIQVIAEEVVGALDDLVVDLDIALVAQLRHQFATASWGTMSSRSPWTIRPEEGQGARKLKSRYWRAEHADEAGDLRPAHQKLHADPRAEGKSGDPAGRGVRVIGLQPIQRGRGIAELPSPRSNLPWLRPTPRKLKRKTENPRSANSW